MKGNQQIIDALNARLAEELGAINQYVVHAEMYENWGYGALKGVTMKFAIQEMKHAEMLIARILFLEGLPNPIPTVPKIGGDIKGMLLSDLAGEKTAIFKYNESITLARNAGDNVTRDLWETILKDEDAHVDYWEAQLEQINQMGLGNYLTMQIGD